MRLYYCAASTLTPAGGSLVVQADTDTEDG